RRTTKIRGDARGNPRSVGSEAKLAIYQIGELLSGSKAPLDAHHPIIAGSQSFSNLRFDLCQGRPHVAALQLLTAMVSRCRPRSSVSVAKSAASGPIQ